MSKRKRNTSYRGDQSEGSLTESVKETVQNTASSAADTVQQAANAVVDTAQQATSAVTGTVGDKVAAATDAAAGKVEQVANMIEETTDRRDVSSGTRQVADTTVGALDRTAEYLRNGDINIVVEDLRAVVRRHPLRSLVVGLGLGYLARNTFFPAAPEQPSGRTQGHAMPYAPSFQQVPVYNERNYGSIGTTYGDSSYTDYGDSGARSGAGGYSSTAYGSTRAGYGATSDVGTGAYAGTVSGSSSGTGSYGSTVGDSAAFGGEAMRSDDALTGIDTLGLGPDETSASLTGTATELLDASSTSDTTDTVFATGTADMIGTTSGASSSALGTSFDADEPLAITGDNELVADDAPVGGFSLDNVDTDASDLLSDEQFSASDDATTGSGTDSTMPTSDQLRNWDDATTGSGQNS